MQGRLGGFNVTIPDPPVVEGWEAVEYRDQMIGDWYCSGGNMYCASQNWASPSWIMRRKPRRRIVFEECGEPTRDDQGRVFFETPSGGVGWCSIESAGACRVDSYRWLRRTDEEVGE